jgi:hypothetical protein
MRKKIKKLRIKARQERESGKLTTNLHHYLKIKDKTGKKGNSEN